jgi:hypothetical protein
VQKVAILFLVLVGAGATAAKSLAAEPSLLVQLASGRQFRGTIDGTSSDQQLVLRSLERNITQWRSINWERIVAAQLDAAPIQIVQLQELARLERDRAATDQRHTRRSLIEIRGTPIDAVPLAVPPPVSPPRVVTVTFDAFVANWDGDVETDGLVLEIAAIDEFGYLAAANGTLQVELFAPQRRVFHHAPLSGGDTLELVERWTRAVSADNVGPAGFRVRLPFGAVHPEIDFDWVASWYGLVHVQLALPGHGVFEDSKDGVRIRPWAPNRDNLEMNTGRRFLPTERLGRHD